MIKGLTISEPWASTIARGEKWVENRGWVTSYRGWLAIHAGKGGQYLTRDELKAYPVSHIVAIARLVGCFSLEAIRANAFYKLSAATKAPGCSRTWGEIKAHKFTEGPCCLILENVFKLPDPVPMSGAQGLWTVPEAVVDNLRAQATEFIQALNREAAAK